MTPTDTLREAVANPGSDEAIAKGCICAVLDNCHGRGHLGDGEKYGWWVTEGCPLHAPRLDATVRSGEEG